MNRAYIEQSSTTRDHDGNKSVTISVYDDYANGTVTVESRFDDDLELLQYCKDMASDEDASVCDVIDGILEYGIGVTINGVDYTWNQIEHIFEE